MNMPLFKTTKDLRIEELEKQLSEAQLTIEKLLSDHSNMIDGCIKTLNTIVPTEAV